MLSFFMSKESACRLKGHIRVTKNPLSCWAWSLRRPNLTTDVAVIAYLKGGHCW